MPADRDLADPDVADLLERMTRRRRARRRAAFVSAAPVAALESATGLDVYESTEAPGINITVTGEGSLTDEQVRAVISALRRVQ